MENHNNPDDQRSAEEEIMSQELLKEGEETLEPVVSGEQEVTLEGQKSPELPDDKETSEPVVSGEQEVTLEVQRSPELPDDKETLEQVVSDEQDVTLAGQRSPEFPSGRKSEISDPEIEGELQEKQWDSTDENLNKISETNIDEKINEDTENPSDIQELENNLPLNLELNNKESELNQNFQTYSIDNTSITDSVNEKSSYVIEEFKESSYYLKFDINNSGTIFKIYLPTLKKIVEPEPNYDYKIRPRNKSPIRKAIRNAEERVKEHNMYYGHDKVYKTAVKTGNNHIVRIERARRIKLRLKSNISAIKELPISPEKYNPQVGSNKRPTEYPPMKFNSPSPRVGEDRYAARLRGSRDQYNRRSDDAWIHKLRSRQPLRVVEKPIVFATPPQRHDPWRAEVRASQAVKTTPYKEYSKTDMSTSRSVRVKQMNLSYRKSFY